MGWPFLLLYIVFGCDEWLIHIYQVHEMQKMFYVYSSSLSYSSRAQDQNLRNIIHGDIIMEWEPNTYILESGSRVEFSS